MADYWINLARSYGHLSTCFELEDQDICFLSSDDNQKDCDSLNMLALYSSHEHDFQGVNNKPSTVHKNEFHDIGTSKHIKDTRTSTSTNTIERIKEMVLDNKDITTTTTTRTNEEQKEVMLRLRCNGSVCLNTEGTDITEVKSFVQNHRYCFCTLCSLIIAR